MLHFTQDGLKLSPSLSYRESVPQEQKISIPQKKDFQDVFPILCRFVGQSLFVSSYPSLRWQMTPFLLPAESCGHCSHLGLQMSECRRQSKGGREKDGDSFDFRQISVSSFVARSHRSSTFYIVLRCFRIGTPALPAFIIGWLWWCMFRCVVFLIMYGLMVKTFNSVQPWFIKAWCGMFYTMLNY